MSNSNWPALLSRDQAAEYLSIGLTQLGRLIASDEIKPVQIPGNDRDLKFKRVDLDKFIERLSYATSSKKVGLRKSLTRKASEARRNGTAVGVDGSSAQMAGTL